MFTDLYQNFAELGDVNGSDAQIRMISRNLSNLLNSIYYFNLILRKDVTHDQLAGGEKKLLFRAPDAGSPRNASAAPGDSGQHRGARPYFIASPARCEVSPADVRRRHIKTAKNWAKSWQARRPRVPGLHTIHIQQKVLNTIALKKEAGCARGFPYSTSFSTAISQCSLRYSTLQNS